jgi:23S rRNA pseudoU1915 N3-methylase RlmH
MWPQIHEKVQAAIGQYVRGENIEFGARWCWRLESSRVNCRREDQDCVGGEDERGGDPGADGRISEADRAFRARGRVALRDEAALLQLCGRATSAKARRPTGGKSTLVLMDSRGKQLSSEEFAHFLGEYQDRNPIPLVFAVGPADGFSDPTRSAAQHTISFGRMTLAHELARVVLLEQVYRAFTILKGHPYHSGH